MTDNTDNRNSARALRRKAEEKLAYQSASHSETDVKHLLHEFQVHQVALKMQNEEFETMWEDKYDTNLYLAIILE
jgi:hypothetical protein